jgi:hypothetical protein
VLTIPVHIYINMWYTHNVQGALLYLVVRVLVGYPCYKPTIVTTQLFVHYFRLACQTVLDESVRNLYVHQYYL